MTSSPSPLMDSMTKETPCLLPPMHMGYSGICYPLMICIMILTGTDSGAYALPGRIRDGSLKLRYPGKLFDTPNQTTVSKAGVLMFTETGDSPMRLLLFQRSPVSSAHCAWTTLVF